MQILLVVLIFSGRTSILPGAPSANGRSGPTAVQRNFLPDLMNDRDLSALVPKKQLERKLQSELPNARIYSRATDDAERR